MELCGCCDVSLTDERLECFSSTVGVYDVIVHQLYGDAFSLVQLFYQQLYVNGPCKGWHLIINSVKSQVKA